MGGQLFSSHALRDDESGSLFDQSPLSPGSSPSALLQKASAKTPTAQKHVIVRFVCAPLTAVFRMKCARPRSGDDELSNDKAGMEPGQAKRPSLEELLRMETPTVSSCPENKSLHGKEHAIVVFGITSDAHISCTFEDKQDKPLPPLKNHGAVITDDGRQTAIVPTVKVDLCLKVVPGAGDTATTASPAVPISASLPQAFLQALRMDMGRTKGRYRKLAGSRDAVKAELFYQRPIPLGRRCRVQHLEESPYV